MKFLLPCLLGLMLNILSAADVGGACVTMGSDVVFLTGDVIAADHRQTDRYPEVQYNDAGQPVGLKWLAKNSSTVSKTEMVARVGGKEIRRFVFWNEGGNADGDGLVCVWLGIQDVAPGGGMGFRPFLVFDGDHQVRWWESFCAYDEQDGFTVVLEMTVKGTGVMWEHSTIQVKEDGPVPLRLESGGRGQEESKVKRYHSADTSQ
jgi:hypothetical protein